MRRREVLSGGLASAALAGVSPFALVSCNSARPRMPYGPMSGDVLPDRAIIWGHSDRPSRMMVEWARDPDFRNPVRRPGSLATADTGFTAKLDLTGLPPGADVHYRVAFHDPENESTIGPWETARLRMPDLKPRPIRFTFSGDECGQYFGINLDIGGYRIYEAMRRQRPDFFIHLGDQIYADNPIREEHSTLGNGEPWRNLITPAKMNIAETLDDFRGNFAYNLLDANKRAFLAEVPMLAQWDDHEVRNDWNPDATVASGPSIPELAKRARRAMVEYNPMRVPLDAAGVERSFAMGPSLEVFLLDARSYRGGNHAAAGEAPGAGMYGDRQIAWLKQGLAASRAVWKVIACEMPLTLVVGGGDKVDALANGRPGAPGGREAQLAGVLSFLRAQGIANVVWLSADVHHAEAIHCHPDRAAFKDFLPFWEMVTGPINAGTFGGGPSTPDPTFGAQVAFYAPEKTVSWLSPAHGQQFFGMAEIDPQTHALTLSIHEIDGKMLWSTVVEAAPR